MWSLETLNYLNRQVGKKARKRGKSPFVPAGPENVGNWPPFPFPALRWNIGSSSSGG